MNHRFMPAFAGAMLAIGALTNGCSSSLSPNNLCCTDFKVGADLTGVDFGVDASIKGQFEVFAQAGADFSAVASATLTDVGTACQAIATDLGADPNDPSVKDKGGRDGVTAWCNLAVAQIKASLTASGSLSIIIQPPKCSASIDATASCQGKCSVDGKCDIKANPPKCTGGELTVSCDGSCSASGGASISCTGSCSGSCSGSCEGSASGGVDCDGKCDGNCEAGGSANGSGLQADGSCKGSCKGKCTYRDPSVKLKCTATCSGKCDADCKAAAGAKVTCSGTCTGNATAPKCEGGKLEGGCQVDANCNANCSASVSAKAECTPPSLSITAQASADLKVQAFIHTLEVNLPKILLIFQARGQAFVDIGKGFASASVNIAADPGKLNTKGVACAAAIVDVAAEAAQNAQVSFQAAGSVAGALNIGG